ncbi:MAG: TonB-dependent receptor [Planctomycetes bacterium]|nr:TonB-dependent receptor [Planctomycetota bacterium]
MRPLPTHPAASTALPTAPFGLGLPFALGLLAAGLPAQTPDRAPEPNRQNQTGSQAPGTSTPAPQPQNPPPAPAKPPQRLPDVLITETGPDQHRHLEQVPIDNPGGRDRIGPATLRSTGSMNLQEALRRSPGVTLQEETGSDSLPNIALRGVTNGAEGAWRSINLGMYADGIPLAPAPYGQPGNSLFPLTMERVYAVDIQRGGGAVRYGPNNVAGVVNFLTRPIPEAPTLHQRLRYDSFRNSSTYTALGGTTGPLGLLLEAVYKDGESFRDGGDHRLENYALKSSYRVSDTVRVFAQVERYEDHTHLSDGLTLAAYRQNPKQTLSPLNRFEGKQNRANVKIEWDVGPDTLFELIAYHYDGTRTFLLGNPTFYGSGTPTFLQATPRPMRTVAVQPQITHTYGLGAATGEFHLGARYLQEDIVRSVDRFFPNGTVTRRTEEQYDYYTGSAWVENTFRFDDWTITPGVRLEVVEMDARIRRSTTPANNGRSVERDFTEALPGLSLARRMTEHWSLFASAQRTFAAPQAPQISILSDTQDITAQHAWVYEVGSRTRGLDGLLQTDVTLYQIDYRGRLVPDPDQVEVFLNAGTSRHRGVEVALGSDLAALGLPGLSLWGTGAYNDSEFTNGQFAGNTFAGAPHWVAAWGARYQHAGTGLWLGIDGSYTGSAYSDAENTVEINAQGTRGVRPSYRLWNASVGWDWQASKATEVNVMVGGRNVLDEDYFEVRAARGIFPGAPASLVGQVGVTHRF